MLHRGAITGAAMVVTLCDCRRSLLAPPRIRAIEAALAELPASAAARLEVRRAAQPEAH
jgi:hypothetical protein